MRKCASPVTRAALMMIQAATITVCAARNTRVPEKRTNAPAFSANQSPPKPPGVWFFPQWLTPPAPAGDIPALKLQNPGRRGLGSILFGGCACSLLLALEFFLFFSLLLQLPPALLKLVIRFGHGVENNQATAGAAVCRLVVSARRVLSCAVRFTIAEATPWYFLPVFFTIPCPTRFWSLS
jgi:hypothetical protein